jgi:hypothetical protein
VFTIHTSDSPLLDYINFKTYRNIEVQGLTKDLGREVYGNVMVLIGNMDLSSHEYYMTWLHVWKQVNAVLSKYNHHLKRPKNRSGVYLEIYAASIRQIAREWGIKDREEYDRRLPFMIEEFESRREQYIAWAEKTLTALYNARTNGKLASSHIVTMKRIETAGSSIGDKLYKLFSKAA